MYQGNRNLLHQKWLMHGGKRFFQFFYETTSLKTFTTLMMNLNYSMNVFQIKLALFTYTSWRKADKQQLEIVFRVYRRNY